jgi:pyruvate,orthophosphate dikinase
MVEIAEMRITGKNAKELETKEALLKKVKSLHEFNPMLGHRLPPGDHLPRGLRDADQGIFNAAAA